MLTLSALAVTAVLVAGCGSSASAGEDAGPPVATSQVRVVDNAFEPPDAELTAGDTLTWQWEGDSNHNVVGDDFESDTQSDGRFEHTFAEPGTYTYQCTLHGGMTGTVTVVSAGGDGT